jgi:hypothetical protein
MKLISTALCFALACTAQSVDARRSVSTSSDECFTDPRGTMRNILNEMRYTYGIMSKSILTIMERLFILLDGIEATLSTTLIILPTAKSTEWSTRTKNVG